MVLVNSVMMMRKMRKMTRKVMRKVMKKVIRKVMRTLLKMAAATKPDNRHGAPSVGEEPVRFLAQVDVHHIEWHLVDDL